MARGRRCGGESVASKGGCGEKGRWVDRARVGESSRGNIVCACSERRLRQELGSDWASPGNDL